MTITTRLERGNHTSAVGQVLTYFEPVNAIRNLAVCARLLDSWSEVRVSQRDAAVVAARGIHNLTRWNGTVGFDPVALPPTVGGGQVGDLLAVAMQLCRCELAHSRKISRARL